MNWYAAGAALVLALTHIFAEKLRFTPIPRSKWLSFAGGVAVSYIFLHILPELQEMQSIFEEQEDFLSYLKHHTYLIALLGLTLFYGLERAAKLAHDKRVPATTTTQEVKQDEKSIRVFWLHIISFGLYNALIGYLLVYKEAFDLLELLWFTIAMAFHFMINDYGLLHHYKHYYRKRGRWILCLAIGIGWAVGSWMPVQELWISLLFAFVAGSTILNVLKEELPEERKSNFKAFIFGIVLYSGMLLLL
ncbi:ZIP family transporter [Cesiribacter andamanensis]|uniref:ZIP Zinc transporter n=1 Tax=Cesiribacter andamanensis AMV16 TaxID=1279009 RepID=M7N6W4_9BACT|nr:ZIP zinc transporter [Cesiribacter andamanensis]EMR04338.1 ZIP Zinc transporter [Cesiribacter andamanensis AMV16]